MYIIVFTFKIWSRMAINKAKYKIKQAYLYLNILYHFIFHFYKVKKQKSNIPVFFKILTFNIKK